jgi:hypothetical protein
MIADFMIKPLQGSVFNKFRDLIMGAILTEDMHKILTPDSTKETNHKGLAHK